MPLSYKSGRALEERLAVILDRNENTGAPRMAKIILDELGDQLTYDGEGDDNYGSWSSSGSLC